MNPLHETHDEWLKQAKENPPSLERWQRWMVDPASATTQKYFQGYSFQDKDGNTISGNEGRGTLFYAFQVTLDYRVPKTELWLIDTYGNRHRIINLETREVPAEGAD